MQLMLPQHFMITPEMHHTIREILNCKRTGIYKKMFLEARTIELLLLQLEQINAPNDQISLSKSDCEKCMLYEILSNSILQRLIRL